MTIHRPVPIRAVSAIALSVIVLVQLAACGPASPSVVPPASSAGVAATPAASASPVPSATPTPSAEPSITADAAVETVVDGLVAPVGLVAPPDDTGRLFVLEQTGLISVLQPGAATVTPFLDLRDRVVSSGRTTTSAACSASRSTRLRDQWPLLRVLRRGTA